jgi:dephospho-CoA kinase
MLKIGITGGIGTGKTTVCKVFEMLGVPVFYADVAAKLVMRSDVILKEGIIRIFGKDSYTSGGELDRKYLADIVFNDNKKIEQLNSLVHPAVFRAFDTWLAVQKSTYVLKEAALLFETGSYKSCNYTLLVTAPKELRIKRVIQRDAVSEEQVLSRMSKQLSDEEKAKLADFIITNDEVHLLIPQIIKLHQHFIKIGEHLDD